MPSTYTTNTGIEKPGDGEQAGSWGDTANDNFDIIDRAINGVGSIALSGTTHTLTTSDGALSDGQYRVLVLGGSPSGTNTITLSPNDAQHLYFVRNNSGQSAVFTQGSGGNVTVPNGRGAIIYANGAGSGAAVVDLTSLFGFQPVDAALTSISGLTTSANQMLYTTASDTYATTSLTSAGRDLLDDADAAAQRTTLGLGTMSTQNANAIAVTGGTAHGMTTVAVGTPTPTATITAVATGVTIPARISSSDYIYTLATTPTANDGRTGYEIRVNDLAGVSRSSYFVNWGGYTAIIVNHNNPFAVLTNGTERMRVTGSGDVGIETTAPTAKLDVNGTTRLRGAVTLGSTALTASAAELNILDGVTASTTEINRLVGVTSAVQTQIDSKAPLTGSGASGQWNINAYPRRSDGTNISIQWSGQAGQPNWVVGSNDGVNFPVWNPANFSVNYANSAGSATTATTATTAITATTATVANNAIGYNQTWQDVAASRSLGVSYQNTTGRSIAVFIARSIAFSQQTVDVSPDNVNWANVGFTGSPSVCAEAIIPAGWFYRQTGSGAHGGQWMELK